MQFEGKKYLVTGGCGYIGSHTVVELLNDGASVVIVDNLVNSSEVVIDRLGEITGKGDKIVFKKIDILDQLALDAVFTSEGPFDGVLHFAALKAVGESVKKPLSYYKNNLGGAFSLLESMQKHDCKTIIFSSSCTVHGSAPVPYTEESPVGVGLTNPYAQTKFMIEQILKDTCIADPTFKVCNLRYFNPVGAHKSGRIGEDPRDIPNNLVPYVLQVGVGKRPHVNVFGNDYDTPDGTGVRDYIHVVDLAKGHTAALNYIISKNVTGFEVFNLGTGHGTSVLEIIDAVRKASGKEIPYKITPRRTGDIAIAYANTDKSTNVLGWSAQYGIEAMCADSWKWQSGNPNGYEG